VLRQCLLYGLTADKMDYLLFFWNEVWIKTSALPVPFGFGSEAIQGEVANLSKSYFRSLCPKTVK
jgi:hypothetical protein